MIAPEAADAEEARLVAADEAPARERTRFSLHPCGDGTVEGRFTIPELHAAMLRHALENLTRPRRRHPDRAEPGATATDSGADSRGWVDPETGRRMPYPEILGGGFCELLEHLPTDGFPHHGQSPATVVVTITRESLQADLTQVDLTGTALLPAVGRLTTGGRLSAAATRRLACTAGLLPAVLGGGTTDLANALLLCAHHHHRAHDPTSTMTRLPTGDYQFHRRS